MEPEIIGATGNPVAVAVPLVGIVDERHRVYPRRFLLCPLNILHNPASARRVQDDGKFTVTRKPGPMTYAPDETGCRKVIAFIQDPDGYKIELIKASVC